MTITPDDIKKLAQLTQLALSEEQQAEAVDSLNAVLGLIDQLKSADVDHIDPLAYVQLHGQTLRTRPPQPGSGYPVAELMQNAPAAAEGYFLVPRVIE